METLVFKIRINDTEYMACLDALEFQALDSGDPHKRKSVPLDQFRSKGESWFILWDRKSGTYHGAKGALQPIPLSVEWVQVTFLDQHKGMRERLELIIRLFESIALLRITEVGADVRRQDTNLSRTLMQYLNSRV